MGNYLNLIIPFYSALLRLYPKRFRAEFKDDMRTVFSTSLEQAAKQGILALASVILREWFHAPLAILSMHCFSWKKNEQATGNSTTEFSPLPNPFLPPPAPDGRTPWLVVSVLLMVAGTLAYSQSRRTVLQMTALMGGMSLSFCCAPSEWLFSKANGVLLDQAAFVGGLASWVASPTSWLAEIGWVLRLWASMTALITAPFLIGLTYRALGLGQTAQTGGL